MPSLINVYILLLMSRYGLSFILQPNDQTELKQTQWPYGDYALLTIAYGCPETIDHGWTYGYVNMTLNADTINMLWNDDDPVTFEPHILGPFTQSTLQINFCIMKTSIPRYVNNTEMQKWPTGNYCIFKVGGSCPDDFEEGTMTMRGLSFEFGGDLPNVTADNSSLRLSFCCREDGPTSTAIHLPDYPFLLFKGPSADDCQEVLNTDKKYEEFHIPNDHQDFEFDGTLPKLATHKYNGTHVGLPICYYYPTTYLTKNHRHVGTYVSKNRWDFLTYGATRCARNRNPRTLSTFRYDCQQPTVGQFVSVKNFDLTDPDNTEGFLNYFEISNLMEFQTCVENV